MHSRLGVNLLGVLGGLVDLVYPPVCMTCGMIVGAHKSVCASCWRHMAFIEEPYCAILGVPFDHDPGEGTVSAAAIADPPRFDRARAAVLFDDRARMLVHGLKYRDRTDLAKAMAPWMLRSGGEFLAACDGIVAVPLHRTRLRQRKYNQSAELARALGRLAGRPFLAGGLVRKRATHEQVGLGTRQRQDNVRGAFLVPQGCLDGIAGRRLVLVDDVYTTGATANAAAQALKKAGAADVTVLTFARVPQGHI